MLPVSYRLPIYVLVAVAYLVAMYCVYGAMRRREERRHWEERAARDRAMHERDNNV